MKINHIVQESYQTCPECGGPAFSDLLLAEKKDACYNKVRSRYKVWPSAYASGALVQCRKKGAKNWGTKSESVAEAVGGNYLYHATGANGLASILQSGYIKSAAGPQKATQAQTALPTVSVTRDWGYASGSNAQSQDGGIGRDAIFILDRNALESNYKTISTSQSRDIRGMPRASEPGLSGALAVRKTVVKPGVELKGQHKMSYGTAKAGGEFEEAVVVPKGVLPLKGTMVGFWVNPKSELMKDPAIMNDPRRLDLVRPNQFVKAKQQQGLAEGFDESFSPDELLILNRYLDDEISWHELKRGYSDLVGKAIKRFDVGSMSGVPMEFQFYDRLGQARDEGDLGEQGVAEAINPDITNPAFSHQQQIGDYLYVARYWKDGLKISAYHGSKRIGYAELMYHSAPFDDFADPKKTPKRMWLESEWTEVDPKYQRQGIMSTMYAYAKMLGNSVKPSQFRSADAQAAWKSWKQAGDTAHLTREGVAEGQINEWVDPGAPCAHCGLPHGQHRVQFNRKNPKLSFINPDDEWNDLAMANAEDHEYTPAQGYKPLSQREAELVGFRNLNVNMPNDIYDRINKVRQRTGRVGPNAGKLTRIKEQGVAEGVNNYLWHGSRNEHEVLYPRQANDTGGKEESNKNAVYATPNAKVAIAMGLTTPGSDTGMFPNDPQMVLFKGGIRKGEMVYLHKVPKDLFIKHNGREWFSKPGVEEVKPIEVVKVPVDKYLNLIRQATPADLELQKKYMKQQGVAEGSYSKYDRVGFSVDSERAYNAVMKRFGDIIDHDEDSGIMYVPRHVWPKVEQVAFDADGIGAQRDDDLENPEHYGVAEGNDEKIAGRYDPDDFDAMVNRLKKLAGAGPMKTVYDPKKRVYRNIPTAQQPPKK